MASIASCVDLNLHLNHAKESCTPQQALYELLANALDANAAAGTTDKPKLSTSPEGTTLILEDIGRGISPGDFVVGDSNPEVAKVSSATRSRGCFGIGLKDAIAALYRDGKTVEVKSAKTDASVVLKLGSLGKPTLHVMFAPSTRSIGTAIYIHGFTPEKARGVLLSARASFIEMRDDTTEPRVTVGENISVLSSLSRTTITIDTVYIFVCYPLYI